jgi:hypothetical protein
LYLFLHKALCFFTSVATKKSYKHRGQALAAAVTTSGMNVAEVAVKAGYSRSAYYKHVKRTDLDFHILIEYGKVMRFDFSDEFPDMPKYLLQEPDEIYGVPDTLEQAKTMLVQLKSKYTDLLEKYNLLMEEKVEWVKKEK